MREKAEEEADVLEAVVRLAMLRLAREEERVGRAA